MIDEFEVHKNTNIEDLLSKAELDKAHMTTYQGWDVVYNFLSAQVIVKKEDTLYIIPLSDLKKADKHLHKEYWKIREDIAKLNAHDKNRR